MPLTPEQAAELGLPPIQSQPARLTDEQARGLGLPVVPQASPAPAPEKPGPLTSALDATYARATTPRQMLPGVFALLKGTPENTAEHAATDAIRNADPRNGGLVAAVDAFHSTPIASLTYAPMAGPPTQVTTVKPPRLLKSPAAVELEKQGVKGLTAGQIAGPNSTLGMIEAVSEHNPMGMKAERDAAKQAFQRTAQNKGAAPGAQIPATPDLQARMGELIAGYEPAYARFQKIPVAPDVVSSLPDAAALPTRGFDAKTAQGVRAEVQNALTILGPEPKAPAPSGLLGPNGQPIPPPAPTPRTASVGDLLKVRGNIRESIRAARQAQDFDRLRLLDHAEGVVTEAIEKSLPPAEAALLQKTDQQYSRLMTALNAPPAGQTEFTPLQYLKQVEKGSGKRTFRQGEAGDLQDLGQAARATFEEAPKTGFRATVLSAIPGLKYAAAPISRIANTEAGKRFLFEPRTKTVNPRPPETFMGVPGMALAHSPEIDAMLRVLDRRLRLQAGSADEEGR